MSDEQWILYIKEKLLLIDENKFSIDDWRRELLQFQRKEKKES